MFVSSQLAWQTTTAQLKQVFPESTRFLTVLTTLCPLSRGFRRPPISQLSSMVCLSLHATDISPFILSS